MTSCKLLLLSLVVLSVGPAVAAETYDPNKSPPLVRIHSLYNPNTTDQLLTQHPDEANWLRSISWGTDTGDIIYLEKQPQPTTVPLRRFYKGGPQDEHFYTTSQADADAIIPQGWVDEGIVGHIYAEQVPGSFALYRLSRYNGATGDLVHRYTLSSSVRSSLISEGFAYEGITGYVYKAVRPTVAGGHIMGVRCGLTDPNAGCVRNDYFGLYKSVSSIGSRPSWATRQTMRFRFWTPDMFGSATMPSSDEHLAFVPRGILQIVLNDLHTSKVHGIGLILSGDDQQAFGCYQPDRAFIEEWWPIPPVYGSAYWASYNFTDTQTGGSTGLQTTCAASRMANRTWYDVTVSVTNTGVASYSIHAGSTYIGGGSAAYGSSPQAESPFDSTATGYWLTNTSTATRNYTAYVTNLVVSWE